MKQKLSLIWGLARRDFQLRYKGSGLGILWSLLNPLFLLVVYSFVFSYVLKARWGVEGETHTSFAVILFTGLIVHGFFAEVLTRASGSILENPNYVKKIVFPVGILPLVVVAGSGLHFLISFLVLLAGVLVVIGKISVLTLLLPVVIIPFVIFLAGLAILLASLTVYLRDIQMVAPLISTLMLFISPILYPINNLPETVQKFISLNPLTLIVENMRKIIVFAELPDFSGLFIYAILASLFFVFSFLIYRKLRPGFADVL